MPANREPIYSYVADVQWGAIITAANTAKDGTGTVETIFTADVTNGGFVQRIIVRPLDTNVATVVRIFLNNGLTNATAGNNALINEATLAATTNSEVAASAGLEIPLNFALPPGYKINFTLGTAVAGGVKLTAIGGKY